MESGEDFLHRHAVVHRGLERLRSCQTSSMPMLPRSTRPDHPEVLRPPRKLNPRLHVSAIICSEENQSWSACSPNATLRRAALLRERAACKSTHLQDLACDRPSTRLEVSIFSEEFSSAKRCSRWGTSFLLIGILRQAWDEWGLGSLRCRTFCELGCEDGFMVFEFCKAFPSYRGLGIDLDGSLIEAARGAAHELGVQSRCDFRAGTVKDVDLSGINALLLSLPREESLEFLNDGLLCSALNIGSMIFCLGDPLPEHPRLSEMMHIRDERVQWSCIYCYMWKELGVVDAEVVDKEEEYPMIEGQAEHSILPLIRRKIRRPRILKIQPKQVLYSNSRISAHFSCGRPLMSTIQDLRTGAIRPEDIPRISIVRRGEHFVTLNHRRLYAFQQSLSDNAEIEVNLLEDSLELAFNIALDCKGQRSIYVDQRF